MQTIKLIGFCLAIVVPAAALTDTDTPIPDESALREECGAFSQAGMRECLSEKVKDSQRALQQAEKKMIDALSQWDEDDKYIREAKTKLSASNKEFVAYRNSQCEFIASLSGGGNGRSIARPACVADLNNRRTARLRDAASSLFKRTQLLREAESAAPPPQSPPTP